MMTTLIMSLTMMMLAIGGTMGGRESIECATRPASQAVGKVLTHWFFSAAVELPMASRKNPYSCLLCRMKMNVPHDACCEISITIKLNPLMKVIIYTPCLQAVMSFDLSWL